MRHRTGLILFALATLLLACAAGCSDEETTKTSCTDDRDCKNGYFCDPSTKTCERNPDSGGGLDMKPEVSLKDGAVPETQKQDVTLPDIVGPDLLKPNGVKCTAQSECQSGFCVNGYCCDTKCDQACYACSLGGKEGTCTPADKGTDPHSNCVGKNVTCAGTCDGNGACDYPSFSVSCGSQTCTSGQLTTPSCDGAGDCKSTPQSCGGYACNSTGDACLTSCVQLVDCASPYQCVFAKCVSNLANGEQCGTNNLACASGYCVDGVCCDTSCTSTCMTCNQTGKLGTCSNTPSGQDPDKECTGTVAACDGSCNGSGACTYPGSTTSCATTTCTFSSLSTYACDSAGGCQKTTTSCGYYPCKSSGTACATSCAKDTECLNSSFCTKSKCQVWKSMTSGTPYNVEGIWGATASDIWAVGQNGNILHYNGSQWSQYYSPTTSYTWGIWGSSASDIWAVSDSSSDPLIHYDGYSWKKFPSTTITVGLFSLWGSSSTNVWVVGYGGAIYRYNGSTWTNDNSVATKTLYSVWGTGTLDVTAVGDGGTAVRRNVSTEKWILTTTGTSNPIFGVHGSSPSNIWAVLYETVLEFVPGAANWKTAKSFSDGVYYYDIWARASNDVFIVGVYGNGAHYDGISWSSINTGTTSNLGDLWQDPSGRLWAVGGSGAILYVD